MKVTDVMTRGVQTCLLTDSLSHAARLMWEKDCGCLPIVDGEGRVVGMITDRDVCMAGYTRGRRLDEMTVASAASTSVVTIGDDETLDRAEKLMRDAQVRRLPVADSTGKLIGLLSIGDLARRAEELQDGLPRHIVGALAGICQPRLPPAQPPALTAKQTTVASGAAEEVPKSLALLQSLRDEVRVRLHLGTMDLKDQWNKLEPHLAEVEKKAEELSDASRVAIMDAVRKLQRFRASLMGHG